MTRFAVLLAAAIAFPPQIASAEDCTYVDLQGQFSITLGCEQLQDYSGIGQEKKRIWLANQQVHVQVMEVPDPYRTAELAVVMEKLGRSWGAARTPVPLAPTTVAGKDALVITERTPNATSRTWVFMLEGRNLTARVVAFGKRKAREEALETYSQLLLQGLQLKAG